MKKLLPLLLLCFILQATAQKKQPFPQRIQKTVAQDGSGNYKTVQAAFDAIPLNNKTPITIIIGDGIYKEKLFLDSTKNFVTLIGNNKFNTILNLQRPYWQTFPEGRYNQYQNILEF